MAKLIYSAIASLDGYTADSKGGFDWAAPSEEVHAFVNDLERDIGTYLYGRKMYETMQVWQTMPTDPDQSYAAHDYAQIWKDADKIVYSSTLTTASTPRTRIEPRFDPAVVRDLADSSERAVSVGGPTLAAEALRFGLVDEVQLFLVPVSVGGGTPALPRGSFLTLELLDQRRFANGTVYLNYSVAAAGGTIT